MFLGVKGKERRRGREIEILLRGRGRCGGVMARMFGWLRILRRVGR